MNVQERRQSALPTTAWTRRLCYFIDVAFFSFSFFPAQQKNEIILIHIPTLSYNRTFNEKKHHKLDESNFQNLNVHTSRIYHNLPPSQQPWKSHFSETNPPVCTSASWDIGYNCVITPDVTVGNELADTAARQATSILLHPDVSATLSGFPQASPDVSTPGMAQSVDYLGS